MKKKKDDFLNFIYISVAFHVAILIVLTVKVLFFPSEVPEHQSAVRIDVVALPEKQVEKPKPQKIEKPKAPKKKKKKVAKKPKKTKKPKKKKPTIAEKKKVKKDQDSAIAKLKERMKKQKEEEAAQPEYKGNEISKGNSLSGMNKIKYDAYESQVTEHIRNHWNLPEWLANGNFKARVLLLISKNGDIQSKSFIMKSGNEIFDQYVISTLEKATPLPAPPASLINYYATKGIKYAFPED